MSASSALSIPVAFSDLAGPEGASSSCARSRPRDVFLGAALEDFGADLRDFSSSASRASFSAFLRASSSFLAASASLCVVSHVLKSLKGDTYFLELFFAPRPQSSSSTLAWDCCAAAALAAAASAFCALPETFLPFSPKFFLPAMIMKGCVLVIGGMFRCDRWIYIASNSIAEMVF